MKRKLNEPNPNVQPKKYICAKKYAKVVQKTNALALFPNEADLIFVTLVYKKKKNQATSLQWRFFN